MSKQIRETQVQHWLRQYKYAVGNQVLFARLAEVLPEKSYQEKFRAEGSRVDQLWAIKPAEISWNQVLRELNKATPLFKRTIREQERWNLSSDRVIYQGNQIYNLS
jgi:hypothetical protein